MPQAQVKGCWDLGQNVMYQAESLGRFIDFFVEPFLVAVLFATFGVGIPSQKLAKKGDILQIMFWFGLGGMAMTWANHHTWS